MCIAALGAIVGVLQGVAQFAAAQADYQAKSEQWRQNYTNSLAGARQEQAQLLTKAMQQDDAKSLNLNKINIEEAQKKSEASLMMAEGGNANSGLSVDFVLQDLGRKAAFNREAEKRNFDNQAYQITQELNSTNIRAKNNINSVTRPTAPNPLSLFTSVAGAALQMA